MNDEDGKVHAIIKWDLAAPETVDATVWGTLSKTFTAVLPPGVTATSGPAYSIRGSFRASAPAFKYGDIVHVDDRPDLREMVTHIEEIDGRTFLRTLILDHDIEDGYLMPSGMWMKDAKKVTE